MDAANRDAGIVLWWYPRPEDGGYRDVDKLEAVHVVNGHEQSYEIVKETKVCTKT